MRTLRRSRHAGRRGGVLIVCVLVAMGIAALSAALLQVESSRSRAQLSSYEQKRAFNLAEAGLAEAYLAISIGRTGDVGSRERPAKYGGGFLWVDATDLGHNVIGLESYGLFRGARAAQSLVVQRKPGSIASLGIHGSNQVSIGAESRIDSYDSRVGPPTGHVPDSAVFRVQSNNDVLVGERAKVVGDAIPGPHGAVLLGRRAVVTGSTAPSQTETALPDVVFPVVTEHGALPITLLPSTRTLSGDAGYTNVDVGALSKLVLEGPAQVVVGTLRVRDLAKLEFRTSGGPVNLYVKDWIDLAPLATVTFLELDPTKVSLQVAGSTLVDHNGDGSVDPPLRLGAKLVFYGTLYASDSDITLPNGSQLFGTVAAQTLTLGAGVNVHFDVALEELADSTAGSAHKLSWRTIDVPPELATRREADAGAALGVDEATLVSPAAAVDTSPYVINLQYLDSAGHMRHYRGAENLFDWTLVDSVVRITRSMK